jgi:hypothetical protein
VKIRIKAVPHGDAPESFRRAWVGCILPAQGRLSEDVGERVELGGYRVLADHALDALEGPAHYYWATLLRRGAGAEIIFPEEACEVVEKEA